MSLRERVVEAFERHYGARPSLLARAPGRVNLIGEHTDYNDGFVLPMAIDRAAWIALRPRDDRRVRLASSSFDEAVDLDLDALSRGGPGWAEYPKATAWALIDAGHKLRGFDGVLAGDVPMGAGLSSSAAVELATARAFAAVSDLTWEPSHMALVAQRAENEWVGVKCGIMDQLISAAAREGAALLIDCRSLETTAVPLPVGVAVAVLDTATRRGLVDSAYNERRAQCEAVARVLGVKALRDASPAQVAARAAELEELSCRRGRHVVTENARTLEAVEAMQHGDAVALGLLIDASHRSLRDDFEVSSAALDVMVECARRHPACLGARMTGAGFGGCVVALVRADQAGAFLDHVLGAYQERTSVTPKGYVCHPAGGASVESV